MRNAELLIVPARRWQRWLIAFGIWTFVGCSYALQLYATAWRLGRPRSLLGPLSWYLLFYYKWFAFSPLIFAQARRWPLERGNVLRHLLIHLSFITGFHLISTPIVTTLHWGLGVPLLEPHTSLSAYIKAELTHPVTLLLSFFVYWVVLIVGWGLDYQQKFRAGETKAAVLAAQLADAQLQALKMQLQPHFLFNTLNSISALLHQDVEAADRMVARLGNFLRLTLDNAGAQLTTLKQELEFLRLYLDIEQVRFQDRLQVEWETAPDSLNALIPHLILQPLVENAVRHGIAKQYAQGKIKVSTQIQDGHLQIQIADNGPGLPAHNEFKEGVGVNNTRARLAQFYGDQYTLAFKNRAPHGLLVVLEIPLADETKEDSHDKTSTAF